MTPAARGPGARLIRLLPAGAVGAKRTPFVLLVVVLLGSGLLSLLVLNSSLNQGSFELSRLQRKTTELTDEQQALQQEVDQLAAPDALERRARELGMVPGGSPVFLDPDGTVHGAPSPAAADPASLTTPLEAATPPPAPAAPAPPPLPVPVPVPEAPASQVPQAPQVPAPDARTAVKTVPTTGR
ncbi:FtsB family cell division protein [Streptomyces syringium]|uniref:Cell division protein FtsL n=1 Tax=Streptomyces syringium TaxID=76729 RepID=A0ABS4Y1E3_9ACTN|nr:septum formation initiator family protein [Streptomyces syringium]MBP2402395.1 cell division protein FtsL [Streptomyces syringium]SPE49291.1 cell division protein FtsL [Streptomyces netropsis]